MRAHRLLLVVIVVAAGFAAAWPFRQRRTLSLCEPPRMAVDLPLRRADIALQAGPAGTVSPASTLAEVFGGSPLDGAAGRQIPPASLAPLAPPPALAADFGSPAGGPPHQRHVWQPVRMKLPANTAGMRRHRITDGDSLELLAERYLGDADRASEIFEINRDVLWAPDLLPLGRIIRIPPGGTQADLLTPAQ